MKSIPESKGRSYCWRGGRGGGVGGVGGLGVLSFVEGRDELGCADVCFVFDLAMLRSMFSACKKQL